MAEPRDRSVDVLLIAAHPDDAELGAGGTLCKLAREGKRTAIVDCTRGEMGSRGTPELREKEAARAGEILGLSERCNLAMEDGNIEQSKENIAKIVRMLRRYRPSILIFPPERDRHPDHDNVHRLVRTALFQSGLSKLQTQDEGRSQQEFRPQRAFCFMQTYDFVPTFYVDVTECYEDKIQAIQAYSSQFYVAGNDEYSDEPETFISRPAFREFIDARARYFGSKIGVRYAEAFYTLEPLGLNSLSVLL